MALPDCLALDRRCYANYWRNIPISGNVGGNDLSVGGLIGFNGGTAGFAIGSSINGSLASDYNLTQPVIASVADNITAAPISATALIGGNTSKTYDGVTAASNATVAGNVSEAIAGDTLSLNTSGLALNYNSTHVSTASSISASGAAGFVIGSSTAGSLASDYSFSQPLIASVSGSIGAALLTPIIGIGGATSKSYLNDQTKDNPLLNVLDGGIRLPNGRR